MPRTESGACVTGSAATIERAPGASRASRCKGRAAARHTGVLVALTLLAAPAALDAVEFVSVKADRDGPAYRLRIEAEFAAPPERLLAVMTDYDRMHELHPYILESRSLGPVGPATEEVYTRFQGCVLFYCQTLHRVEHIRVNGTTLFARIVPGRGSFSEGSAVWRVSADGSGTRLSYEGRFVPAFKVAPLIGPAFLARILERMTVETMAEVDRRAMRADD